VSSFIAAGLFDGPWVVIALVVASAIANWLAKRRAEKSGEAVGEEKTSSTPRRSSAPPVADWEERLRRMLGEEAPTAAPPPIIKPSARPAVTQPKDRVAPGLRPAVATATVPLAPELTEGNSGVEETIRRYEQREPGTMPAVRPIISSGAGRPVLLNNSLRQPQAARQAFLASLVFGPPKGLEG